MKHKSKILGWTSAFQTFYDLLGYIYFPLLGKDKGDEMQYKSRWWQNAPNIGFLKSSNHCDHFGREKKNPTAVCMQ